jgi:hypothetical protein
MEPIAVQRVLQEARMAASGESRDVLALLQAAYLEEVIRLAIAEQPSSRQLPTIEAFCVVAGQRLLDTARTYRRDDYVVHNAPEQARRFGSALRDSLDCNDLTQRPFDH